MALLLAGSCPHRQGITYYVGAALATSQVRTHIFFLSMDKCCPVPAEFRPLAPGRVPRRPFLDRRRLSRRRRNSEPGAEGATVVHRLQNTMPLHHHLLPNLLIRRQGQQLVKELYLSAMIKACALDSSAHPDFLTHGFGTVVSPTADVFYATLSTMLDCSDEALTTSIGYVEYCQLLRSLARVRLHKRSGRPFLISPDQPRRLYFRNVVHPGITHVAPPL